MPVHGEVVTSDVPAHVAVDDDQTPLQAYANAPDLTDPWHAALIWWMALNDRGRYLNAQHDLTWSPPPFGDYAWAEELPAGRSIASRVYFAVDDPACDVAFIARAQSRQRRSRGPRWDDAIAVA